MGLENLTNKKILEVVQATLKEHGIDPKNETAAGLLGAAITDQIRFIKETASEIDQMLIKLIIVEGLDLPVSGTRIGIMASQAILRMMPIADFGGAIESMEDTLKKYRGTGYAGLLKFGIELLDIREKKRQEYEKSHDKKTGDSSNPSKGKDKPPETRGRSEDN